MAAREGKGILPLPEQPPVAAAQRGVGPAQAGQGRGQEARGAKCAGGSQELAALGLRAANLAADIALGLACGLVLSLVVAGAGWLIERAWGTDVYNDAVLRAILPRSRWEWVGVLLALWPAALLEELLFRALPLAGLAWLIAPRWLLWPLSVGFGLLHWPQGSWGVLGATLAGVVFGLLFLFTGSLWVPLAAHYILNVTQLLLAQATRTQPLR